MTREEAIKALSARLISDDVLYVDDISYPQALAFAIDALKAQEPRVMTLDEIGKALKMPLWKETKSANKYLYTGWVLAYDIQKGEGITGTRLGMSEPSGRVVWYRLDDYGKTWRCWTSRPDEKRRAETPWN